MDRPLLTGLAAGLAVVAAAAGGYLVHSAVSPRPAVSIQAAAPATSVPETLQATFVGVAQQLRPAVVNVGTIQRSRSRRPIAPQPGTDDPFFQDFFKQFFGSDAPGQRPEFRQPSLGSGVIIDKRGLVLTNFHVIKGADEITVRLSDKREYQGKVLGVDPKTDLAVLRFEPDHELRVAALGDSDALRVGEWAIAIGNPFGLDQTVTVGVISATGRSDVGVATYENFIQTDAFNTAIVAAGQGIGFAIPINMVKRVVDQLVEKGKVVRGWLGVALQPLSPELAQTLGVTGGGALVASTIPGSPAAAAGLQQGDVIVAYDKAPIEDYRQLQRLVADTPVGKTVTLQVLRKKQKIDVTAKVAEVPDDRPRREGPAKPGG
ncbi:MAG: trypsin-like peptidase domain-containing protein [Candidatus Rokubacteria bacterium]|nr:trypsin-like peptidase domain-containing protein [Candidatus Rokubacteria bacterium]